METYLQILNVLEYFETRLDFFYSSFYIISEYFLVIDRLCAPSCATRFNLILIKIIDFSKKD